MKKAFKLYCLNTLSYFLLTLDVRSVAQANIPIALLVNIILASISFSIVKQISKAEGRKEHIAYVLAGATGVLFGILESKILLGH